MSADTVTREHFDATVNELKALIASLAKQPAPKEQITTAEIMAELGLKTRFGFAKWCARYHLHPISRSVYRVDDYRAAKCRAALRDGHNMVRRTRATKTAKAA